MGMKEWRDSLYLRGLCRDCVTNPRQDDTASCRECREKHNKRQRERYKNNSEYRAAARRRNKEWKMRMS